jgi:chemotaxis protein methyltransferase CheR
MNRTRESVRLWRPRWIPTGDKTHVELNQHTYQRFCRLIYQRLGIAFDENKIYFLQKRLERRVKELSLSSMEEYHFLVAYADPEGKELRSLASLVTTSETYMFREYEQLVAFANFCLPEIVEKKTVSGEKTLRIWSAGCSSGEEPYTLAIIIREIFPQSVTWNIQIMATDIDETVLARARAGVYGDRSMRHVPADYRDRHFLARGSYHQIRPETAELVSFSSLNLHERAAMCASMICRGKAPSTIFFTRSTPADSCSWGTPSRLDGSQIPSACAGWIDT